MPAATVATTAQPNAFVGLRCDRLVATRISGNLGCLVGRCASLGKRVGLLCLCWNPTVAERHLVARPRRVFELSAAWFERF